MLHCLSKGTVTASLQVANPRNGCLLPALFPGQTHINQAKVSCGRTCTGLGAAYFCC